MPVLDKKLFLSNLADKLGDFVPANMTSKIIESTAELLTEFDITHFRDDDPGANGNDSLIKLFLDAKALEGRSEKTVAHYRYILKCLEKSANVPFEKMTVHNLRQFLMAERDRGISLRTLEGHRYVFMSFFGWAWKEDIIDKNPTRNLAPIKSQKVIRKPFTPAEIELLKEAATSARDQALICFLLSTGCRISEVCALNLLDINLREKMVKVLGKGNKERVVYFDDVAAMHLDRYLSARTDDSPALFVGKGSTRITPGGVRTMLNRVANNAGVDNVHPHRFRRTLATSLINHGMAIQDVAAVLGHDKIDTTMTYVFIDQRNVETAYRRFA